MPGSGSTWLRRLRPTPEEIRELARREVDPRHHAEFQPIARGPAFAMLALALVGLAALPGCIARLLTARKAEARAAGRSRAK